MKKNKIVHFITSLEMGGAQTVLAELVTRLDQYEHHVMYLHGGAYEAWFCQRGIPLYKVSGLIHSYDPLFFIRVITTLRALSPDLLHTSLWAANWAGRIAGRILAIPTIMALHNCAELNGSLRMLCDALAPRASGVVAVSPEVSKTFGAAYRAPLQVIYNGVAPIEQMSIGRAQLGLNNDDFVIGAVGRLHRVKRFDMLITSFAGFVQRYGHARLVIIGSGGQEDRLREQISALGLQQRVKIITGQNARSYYEIFDCFVLSSQREGISMALLEAMSAGRACIVTHDEPTHPVITAGHNGLLCQGSEQAIQETLEGMLNDGDLREALGIQAQKTVAERFSSERMTQAYNQLFISIICAQNANSI